MPWVRSGTLWSAGGIEIDLTNSRGSWITIKGKTERGTERLAARLLKLLNLKRAL